jgi:hypothetical protein
MLPLEGLVELLVFPVRQLLDAEFGGGESAWAKNRRGEFAIYQK